MGVCESQDLVEHFEGRGHWVEPNVRAECD